MVKHKKTDSPSSVYNSSSVIPALLHDLPTSMLHLPVRTYNSLQRVGITTVGTLFETESATLLKMPSIGSTGVAKIEESKDVLLNSVEDAEINWFHYWEALGISLIPKKINPDLSSEKIISVLGTVIKEILTRNPDDRIWSIVQRRFGLDGASQLTLQELGIVYELSRERVRQLEDSALEELQNALINNQYSSKDYHVHPQILAIVHGLLNVAKEKTTNCILENQLLDYIREQYSIDSEIQKSVLFLFLKVSGIEQIEFDDPNLISIWSTCDKERRNWLKQGIERISTLLTKENPQSMNKVDILLNLNRGVKKSARLSMEQLSELLPLCSSIEEHEEGDFWGKFGCLRSHGHQVERLLIERDEPMHIREISREINHRLLACGKHTVDQRNLVNHHISADSRFVSIGRSGKWALVSWSHINTSTVVDLMMQCLVAHNKPITADEIYSYVSARRSVSRKSIETYLATRDIFTPIDKDTWGLTSWAEAKNTTVWDPEQVARFVETIFKDNHTEDLPYTTVRDALIQAAGISARKANGKLNVNPVIKKQKDPITNELHAIFQPDYKNLLAKTKAQFKRREKTLRQQVAEAVQEQLEKSPGTQLALSELNNRLKGKFNRGTFYSYVAELDFVEKYVIPDTNVTMCRLRHAQEALPFSQVDTIISSDLKNKVSRCLSFLNENDVDIALFLLSKEFEETLKNYLSLAHSKGKFPSLPTDRLSLDVMINFIAKEGLITDQAVLHFLRQKRNDRAHGTMPSIEERKVMMRHAEVTAGMYIDYIKFFDDKMQELK